MFGKARGEFVVNRVGDGFAVLGVDLVVPLPNP